MAKVSPFSSFRLEDFPTQRAWIGSLFLPLNSVLSQICEALNRKLDADNIPTFTKVLSGTGLILPMEFQCEQGFTPSQMVVAKASRAGTPVTLVGAWDISGDTITVSELFEISEEGNSPIDSEAKYSITLKFT